MPYMESDEQNDSWQTGKSDLLFQLDKSTPNHRRNPMRVRINTKEGRESIHGRKDLIQTLERKKSIYKRKDLIQTLERKKSILKGKKIKTN